MKKMLKSKKGFSLIELLIAVAIMVVLAAIAVGIFANVLDNTKKKADADLAKTLETNILTYIYETQDNDLSDTGLSFPTDTNNLIDKFGAAISLSGSSYGPYINDTTAMRNPQGAGFKVTVNATSGQVKVEVVPKGGSGAEVTVS